MTFAFSLAEYLTVSDLGSDPKFQSFLHHILDQYVKLDPQQPFLAIQISQRAVVDSVNNQEDFKYTLIHCEESAKDVTTVTADPESTNNYTKNNQLGDQAQGIHRHKIGFSFAFPKKASVKLESSAAAFSEYNDDASVEKGFSRKSRFVSGACHL